MQEAEECAGDDADANAIATIIIATRIGPLRFIRPPPNSPAL